MKVLLVNPPFYRLLGSHYNGLSLGLAYIAAALNAAGHDAWLYNADFDPQPTYKTLHQIYRDFDGRMDRRPVAEAVERIVEFAPDWVGYSCYTAVLPTIDVISWAVADRLPGVCQVVGGPHATLDPDLAVRLPAVDHVIRGEGERVLPELLVRGGPRTIQAERIQDLDALPFPERGKFHAGSGRDVAYLSTARGCPWRCFYCASPAIWPRTYTRSAENVIAEAGTLSMAASRNAQAETSLHIAENESLYIVDDTFTFDERRAIRIIEGLAGLGIRWKCEARADTITPPLVRAMAAGGCVRVKMGIESGSPRILRSIGKGETVDEMRAAVRLLHEGGVAVTCYLMAGFPGETDDDLRQTIVLARELKADYYSISMVAPYFGTRLFRDALATGLPVDRAPWEVFFHHNRALLLNPNLSRDLIEELWSLCDVRHYA